MSRWRDDDAQQKQVRNTVIGPGLYGAWAVDGRYVHLDKGSALILELQRSMVDTIVQRSHGRALLVEEKIVRWPGYEYTGLTLETRSCTVAGHESPGCMRYGRADYLNYAMCQGDGSVVCHIVNFPKLQAVFWPAFQAGHFKKTTTEQKNHSECAMVPLRWIRDHVGTEASRRIYATPEGRVAVAAFNGTHYRNGRVPVQPRLFEGEV